MKKIIYLILVCFILLAGCGKNELSKYEGVYKLEYTKYIGDTEKNNTTQATLTLNSDGTGTNNHDGVKFNITWVIDGTNIKITENHTESIIEYNGTLENNKLDIFDGDKNNSLTLELVYYKE